MIWILLPLDWGNGFPVSLLYTKQNEPVLVAVASYLPYIHKSGFRFLYKNWLQLFVKLSNYCLQYFILNSNNSLGKQTECRPLRMDVGVCGCSSPALRLNIVWLDSGKKCSVRADGRRYGKTQVTKWLNRCRQFVWLTVSEHVCAFVIEFCFCFSFICAYQWIPGLHEQVRGAVPNAIRDTGCSVHGTNCASLPGLLCCLHQLQRHPKFSKVLHSWTGSSILLPQQKMTIMADRYSQKSNTRGVERSKILIHWNAYQCQWSTTEPQPDGEIIPTMESYVFLWLPSTSCT